MREGVSVREKFAVNSDDASSGVVVVRDGQIACVGSATSVCATSVLETEDTEPIDLEGGAISPGLVSTGSPLGLASGSGALIRAADGLLPSTRDAL